MYILNPDNVKIKELSALPSKYELIIADIATIEVKTKNPTHHAGKRTGWLGESLMTIEVTDGGGD